jgi:hypothetical protein
MGGKNIFGISVYFIEYTLRTVVPSTSAGMQPAVK